MPAIDDIKKLSKAFGNSHRIYTANDSVLIRVAKNNKWKLLAIGLVSLLTPTLLTSFVPMEGESDMAFLHNVQLLCYALPVVLLVVYFLQSKQKVAINLHSKAITYKNQTITPDEVIDVEIEHHRRKQLQVYSVYLIATNYRKILIGATTTSQDKAAMEAYAKAVRDYVKS